jgi:nucleotide-binding universal stress UspA family protein
MTEFRHILFPVDFSPICYAGIPAVKAMVRQYNAKLALLHVVEIPLSWYGSMTSALPEDWDILDQAFLAGEKRLTEFAANHFKDLSDEARLEIFCDKGDPANAILALAEESKPDLIMMPTHGHGPFSTFVLGSVTTRVLHRAQCALWTFAHSEASPEQYEVRNILCAIDLRTHRIDLIQAAIEIGQKFAAEVALVCSIPLQDAGPVANFGADFDQYLAETAKGDMAALQQKAGTNLKTYVENGPIEDVVKAAARDSKAGLVVIGRGSAQRPLGSLTSHSYAIIRNAPCPVLSV